jgi:succinate dehydrogenase / fumarate reductase, membrane anchor subunit
MNYRSPLTTARGLGSAKSGTAHWWLQRVTAVALLPLSYWLVVFLNLCAHAAYAKTLAWLALPINSAGLLAWVLFALYHAASGLQVVIEDYISQEGLKLCTLWFIKVLFMCFAILASITLLRITG